jgi:hypothetical protein
METARTMPGIPVGADAARSPAVDPLDHVFAGAHAHVANWLSSDWHTGIASPMSSQAICVTSTFPRQIAVATQNLVNDLKAFVVALSDWSQSPLHPPTAGTPDPPTDARLGGPPRFVARSGFLTRSDRMPPAPRPARCAGSAETLSTGRREPSNGLRFGHVD